MAPRVASYMSHPVYVVGPDDSLAHARRLLLSKGISRLVVVDGEKPVGVLTVTDIARSVIEDYPNHDLESLKVADAMSKRVVYVKSGTSVKKAAQVMLKYKIGGMPVIDNRGVLAGIITKSDIARVAAERLKGRLEVGPLSRREYSRVKRTHSVVHAYRMMELDPAGKVLVFDSGGELAGIIARRDLAFFLARRVKKGKKGFIRRRERHVYKEAVVASRIYTISLAEDVMTPNPITIDPTADVAEAASIMVEEEIGCLPVVAGGRVESVLTKIEILKIVSGLA